MGRQFKNDRILIVDDFAHMCMSIKRMLNELGEENIETAATGEEAIKLLKKAPFDIVLCDYNLGEGKDGQQVLEESRLTRLLGPSAVYIMITAETSIPYVLGAVEYQPDDYLTKPFTKELLVQRVGRAVERSEEIRKVREAMHKQEYATAVELCKAGLARKSKYLQTYARLLAGIYLTQRDYPQASTFFRAILDRNNFHWARLGLAQVEYAMGNPQAALNLLEPLHRENPLYIEAYDWLAKCALAIGDSQRAEQIMQDSIALTPKSVERLNELGKIALANENLEAASKAYRMAIRYGKHSCRKSAREYVNYSDILLSQGKHHQALLNLKEAKKTFQHDVNDQLQVSSSLVGVHMSQNHLLDAKEELARGQLIYKRHADQISDEASLSLGKAALSTGDAEAINNILTLLVKNHHDDTEFLADIHQLVDQANTGIELNDLIDATAEEMSDLNTRGIELFEQGDLQAALSLFEKAAQEVPSNRSFNLNAAQVMITLMQENGLDEAMKFKSRQYLEHAAAVDGTDERLRELVKRYQRMFDTNSIDV